MSNTSAGKMQDKRYAGEEIDILYNVRRCIHAALCVDHLNQVFDTEKRPWIDASGAAADQIASVVMECPSGALHFQRKDGGANESTPNRNTITIQHNGPLYLRGDLTIQGAGVDLQDETRAALCRCGASANKPFCDNAHKKIDFQAEEAPTDKLEVAETGGGLTVTAHANGPLELQGNLEIFNQAGDLLFAGRKTWLCRCGGSNKKPFCDGTHKTNGFTAD